MTPGSAAGGLERDAVTHAGYATLATWAWFLYGFGAVLPLLRAEEHTSRTVMGLHSLALAAGSLVAGPATVTLVRLLRRRGAVHLGLGLLSAGTLLLVAGRRPALTLPAVLLIGIGGAVLVNAANPTLTEHHGSASASALSEGNAVAAGVGLLAPLAVGAAVALGAGWRPALLVVLPLAGAVVAILRRVPAGTAIDALPPPGGAGNVALPLAFWLLAGVVVTCVGVEFACTAWSADLLRQTAGLSAAAASATVTAVVGGMAVGRVVAGRLALRIPARRLLFGALALTAVGWTITWLATSPLPAVAGLVVTGLGIAGHYPLGMSLALSSAPGRADRATGVVSVGIGLSAGLSPFALGALADATSTHVAFVVVPGLLVGATLLLLVSRATGRAAASPAGGALTRAGRAPRRCGPAAAGTGRRRPAR